MNSTSEVRNEEKENEIWMLQSCQLARCLKPMRAFTLLNISLPFFLLRKGKAWKWYLIPDLSYKFLFTIWHDTCQNRFAYSMDLERNNKMKHKLGITYLACNRAQLVSVLSTCPYIKKLRINWPAIRMENKAASVQQ